LRSYHPPLARMQKLNLISLILFIFILSASATPARRELKQAQIRNAKDRRLVMPALERSERRLKPSKVYHSPNKPAETSPCP